MAFTPFGFKGPSNTKATPFAPFGASTPTPTNPASDPPSAFQKPPPSTGQPYQLFGVQSNPPINQTPPPLAFQNPSLSSGQSPRPSGIQRSSERFNDIQWGSGSFQRPRPSVRPYQFPGAQRPTLNPQFGNDGSRNFLKDHGKNSLVTSPASTSHVLSRSGADTVEIGRSQDSNWKSRSDLFPDQSSRFSRRNQSLVSDIENDSSVDDILPPSTQTWMRSPSSAENNSMRSSSNPNQLTHQEKTPNNSFPYAHEAAEIQEATKRNSSDTVTPDKPLRDDPVFSQRDSRRFSTSPPGPGTKTYMLSRSSDSQFRGQPSVNSFNNAGKTSISPATKRTRSPASYPVEEDIQENYFSSQDHTEGEEEARAKRLARFKDELKPIESRPVDTTLTKSSVNKTTKPVDNKQPFNSLESSTEPLRGDAFSDYENSEQQPSLIIGLCPDMCPESERGERERKGDLDRYERVDGDRNQTSKSLAVKKYTRTAEREAILIRPMPILQITMEYLLSLLDRPYNENFLGMYNFLWDRMRAIRMDLRMQHIFNRESITLLEQMIRLHIIAMHELCEYTKGEGFTEGFDAHLNIEQMNKTSVELFQMYDDHRKKGITIPTEKEFRGYYALLKLDKHPGYKVEPSELSLDLANMTPEIRQTSEVLFARNVARACRTVNFIAFFRLARKSSYLQACLMHAHFSKLRTQALASLHAGLQNNQGLPVSDMSKWIGMEEEDIEALLEYHGFSIKMFEEPYMVKDDVFLHADKDYKTKCSKLVHMKKSRTIAEDVSAPSKDKDVSAFYPLPSLSIEATKGYQLCITAHKQELPPAQNLKKQASISLVDEEMTDSKTSPLPEVDKTVKTSVINPVEPFVINSTVDQQKQNDLMPAGGFYSPMKFYPPFVSPGISQNESWKPNDGHIGVSSGEIKFPFTGGHMQTNLIPGPILQQSPTSMPIEIVPVTATAESPTSVENKGDAGAGSEVEAEAEAENVSNLEDDFSDIDQDDEVVITNQYDEEVANAKLKLIIRLWKRWSSRRSELRKRRQLAATAARNSISVGIPIGFSKSDHSKVCAMFDIDQAMRRRLEEHRKSWSRLNISDVISDIQVRKNPDSKCICWKVIVCTQSKSVNTATSACHAAHSAASQWLSSKLMPPAEHSLSDDNLILSAPGVSVWNKWVSNGPGSDVKCCLSVAKDVEADNDLCEATRGASAVLFLASVNVPLNLQREQLNCILESIPSGSVLPLLVVISSCNGENMEPDTDIILGLGLHDIDKSKIASFTIISIASKSQNGQELHFFDDSQLREGLKWLATNSPLQPNLYHVKPRDLVLTHFSFSLELLKQMPDQEVGPNTCISAFNNALETSKRNIISAAGTNHIGWPCPEIMLVEDNRKERLMVKHCLPNLDWSTAESIKSLNSALENCKLPLFEDDLTWLTVGCASGVELENHARRLEGCVVKYLTQTSNLMGVSFATKEAEVVIQRNARLELHNSSYHIIPRWVAIFQRIINWQIMSLPESSSSLAYVRKSDLSISDSSYADELSSENAFQQSCAPLNLPLLDEMIQICCRPLKSPPPYNHKAQRTVETERVINDHRDMDEEAMLEKNNEACTVIDVRVTVDDERERSRSKREEVAVAVAVKKETVLKRTRDRFDELLEKCNLVQNSIAKKLCVYF